MKCCYAICLVVASFHLAPISDLFSQPLEISTLAGRPGSRGSADGSLSDARFYSISDVAVDGDGNVYVADWGNDVIRKITPEGMVSTLAGKAGESGSNDGVGSEARFDSPRGVAVDDSGNVYVTDSSNDTIRKITPEGVVTTLAGVAGESGLVDGTGSEARFDRPLDIIVGNDGFLYVSDQWNASIRRITFEGEVTTFAYVSGAPEGMAMDDAGNLYVGNWGDGAGDSISKIDPEGNVTLFTGGFSRAERGADGSLAEARFDDPTAVAVASSGIIYVADTLNHTIRKISEGQVTTLAGVAGITGSADGMGAEARFNWPSGIAMDNQDNLLVADRSNNAIRKVTPEGVVTTLAGLAPGSEDGPALEARFDGPRGLTISSSGTVYVADWQNHTIRMISPEGVVSTVAGNAGYIGSDDGVGKGARFHEPTDVELDEAGDIFVADRVNSTIRKVTRDGTVTTFAGLAGERGSDDGPGSEARFYYPEYIAQGNDGDFFVSDTRNHTIRKITQEGVVSTLAGMAGESGSDDGMGSEARFNYPRGLAVDAYGNVFVADRSNHTVRKITPKGAVTTFAGEAGSSGNKDGVGSEARFENPTDLAFDNQGNLYVVGYGDIVRRVTSEGAVSTVAGMSGTVGGADGIGSEASFYNPLGIAIAEDGLIYISNTSDNTIRVGRVVSEAGPELEIVRSGDQVILSWPISAPDFVLETGIIDSSNNSWAPLTEGIATDGNSYILEEDLDDPIRLYRLRKP